MVDASTPKRNPNPNPNPSSSETVANNDDLLNQILLYLPIRSLLRFKSVSKHWLSLITNPHFLHLRTTHPNPRPSGLFLYRYSHQIHPDFDFLSLLNYESPSKPPFNALTFVDDPSDLRILQSCNGLLLCRGLHLYIYNPTTSQFATLPQPPRRVLSPLCCLTTCYDYNLAFDPSKSPHYKVVSVNFSWGLPDHYELEIFSSETGLWSPSGDPFNSDVSFNLGVFWNGALHWISTFGGDSLYFNVDEERLETMPMPPIPDGWEERRPRYFRESRDHLHLIEIYGPRTTQFNVYEMERDYCEWFVKYRVDLDAIPNVFPEMIRSSLDPSDLHYYQFVILGLIREESDEESFLVLHIPGKVIRYNFRDKSFRELSDVPHRPDNECFSFEGSLNFSGWFNAFEFIESLAYV
ncbi:F-box protein [Camellia lanceoleosa]|uniref:F-box protein n=1 Tax=Camellia lanceoleosa TaxID=1840588 RepID=A0ACC0J6H0_9ERIC|nr:F-box protein [Camellia lanceoleosa]